jgi:arabinose-5-phosphate isomerase
MNTFISEEKDSKLTLLSWAKEVFEIEGNSIFQLINKLGDEFCEAIELLYNCKGRVIVCGMGKSGLIGQKIAATLSSTGTPAYFLHPAESTHGDSGILTKGDVVIGISNSGETAELLQVLPIIKRLGIPLIGMSGKRESTLGLRSDVFLDIAVEKEACPLGKAPTASTTATLAMGDALAICLLRKRGFTQEDFLFFHPSGALGRGMLYKVEELMHKGEELPVVSMNDNFVGSLGLISDKRLGCAIIIDEQGKTCGILTDGDIRRTLLKNESVADLLVKDVMTKNPKILSPNELAAKALKIMEDNSITSLVVNSADGQPVGLLHIHNLLRAGVA